MQSLTRAGGGDVNLFNYVGANPVNAIDPLGTAPGEKFHSIIDAASDAMKFINQVSIRQNVEYGAWIYKNPDSSFSYTMPWTEYQAHWTTLGPKPETGKIAADFHTHGAYSGYPYCDEIFSPIDIDNSLTSGRISFLATPNGHLWEYNPLIGILKKIY